MFALKQDYTSFDKDTWLAKEASRLNSSFNNVLKKALKRLPDLDPRIIDLVNLLIKKENKLTLVRKIVVYDDDTRMILVNFISDIVEKYGNSNAQQVFYMINYIVPGMIRIDDLLKDDPVIPAELWEILNGPDQLINEF